MSTTALFVELVVIGFEAGLCLMLLALLFVEPPHASSPAWEVVKQYSLLITGVVFSLVYALGIIVDKAAKWVVEHSAVRSLFRFADGEGEEGRFGRLVRWLQPKRPGASQERDTVNLARYAYVMAHHGDPMSDLLYGRSKVRILRASLITLPLLVVLATAAVTRNLLGAPWIVWAGVTVIVGGMLALTALRFINWVYCYNQWLYSRRLAFFHEAEQAKAAAVRRS